MSVSPELFKNALSRWGSGVTVITTVSPEGRPAGFTATSFTSLSLSPPLVLFCLGLDASVADAFEEAEAFAAHILAREQKELSNRFASRDEDRFAGLRTQPGVGGVPLLEGALARLECHIVDRYPGGDHLIVVGEVQNATVTDGSPLLYFQGKYSGL